MEYFSEVFEKTDVNASLAAGHFNREEVPIEPVKEHMENEIDSDSISVSMKRPFPMNCEGPFHMVYVSGGYGDSSRIIHEYKDTADI